MAAEALLRARIGNSIAEDLLKLTFEAEEAKRIETLASVTIQRSWRGFFVRDGLARCTWAARFVQRCWRGYKGRQRAHQQQLIVAAEMRQRFFDHCATEIQRHWRGYSSRKYRHNFYARKAYLESVMRKTAEVRQELARAQEEQAARLAEEEEQREVAKFEESLQGKHHLLSTGNCGGVFRARYWQYRSAGDAVELKLRSGEYRGWAEELGKPFATLPPPAQKEVLPRYKASIRATEPYNAERERRQIERAVHRRLLMGGEDFYTTAKPLDLGKVSSLVAAEPFKPRIVDVVPERSVPRRWVGPKPQFKTAFPESKEFDFYDPNMAERPPDPARMQVHVPGGGQLPRSSTVGMVSPKNGGGAASLRGSLQGSPAGGVGRRQQAVWRTEAGPRGGSRGSVGLGGLNGPSGGSAGGARPQQASSPFAGGAGAQQGGAVGGDPPAARSESRGGGGAGSAGGPPTPPTVRAVNAVGA